MVAVVAGATGLTGGVLLQKLLKDPTWSEVISVSRRSVGFAHPKLREVLISDLSEMRSVQENLRGDAYFCALGTTLKAAGSRTQFEKVDRTAVADFGQVARHHQARVFVLISATGADAGSRIFYNRVKGQAEEDLKSLGLSSLVIFHPGLLIGAREEKRTGEKWAQRAHRWLSPVLPASFEKRAATRVEVLAEHMHRVAPAAPAGVTVIAAKDIGVQSSF